MPATGNLLRQYYVLAGQMWETGYLRLSPLSNIPLSDTQRSTPQRNDTRPG
jgi:hypothetical protein